METYEVWRATMYAVGVFVTCNVGGLALQEGVRRLTRRKIRLVTAAELARSLSEQWAAAQGQSFEEMRRQVDGLDAEAEPADAPESAEATDEAADGEKDFFSD